MTTEEKYQIHIYHEEKNEDGSNNSVKQLTLAEYEKLIDHACVRQLARDAIEAYEHIVLNYRDFELSTFSTVLNETLLKRDPDSIYLARSEINRQLTNLLSSTYIYTCLLRIKRKNSCNADYSLENSKDPAMVHALKAKFQETTNGYHRTRYQYTFMAALRNIINHSGSLQAVTEMGGEWSIKEKDSGDEGFFQKDKIYPILDQRVTKIEACKILKSRHYREVQEDIPDEFYIREAIRVYVNLFSIAHAEFKRASGEILSVGDDIIRSHMPVDGNYLDASIAKYTESEKRTDTSLGRPSSASAAANETVKSPLHIEHHVMPGEPSAVPKDRGREARKSMGHFRRTIDGDDRLYKRIDVGATKPVDTGVA